MHRKHLIGRAAHLAAVALAVAALAACGRTAPPPAAATPPPLAALTVHAEPAHDEQAWDGVVEAVHEAVISAQTNARVTELPYDVNDAVRKGDVLVRFSDVEQKSARSAAQAQIAAAQAAYTEADASYQRFAEIYGKGFVSRAQLDAERARRDAALAALQSARAQSSQVGQQLDYTVLRAPYDGIVTRRFVQVGEAVQAGPPAPQQLIALASLQDLRVSVQVPQSAIAAIRRYHAAEVVLDDGRRVAAGKVTVFPYADPQTHSFSVRLELPGDGAGLYPGMTVKVAFTSGEAKRLLLPLDTLVQRGELVGAYVLGEHDVALRQLRLGHRYGDRVEVLAGLDDGERVATDPAAAARWLAGHRRGATP
ncbi:efflux RND transporter periplasmic adaptor subunit [Rhodanobacter denitrificans]|uniref:Efflux RND transporter periplasmic adaptor subunit n=1 Tax=Rhodanobacter denitrificans TaxID=666685 RepID=A0A368KDB0_9GAMM|nr:efflux RND transporter periplasmic adaptor subunit [Rhodanobacter denitrificans]RCS28995.1 efflux RND transporter periplasmic adaptor subunit [Rhodanobacter denitrificans]